MIDAAQEEERFRRDLAASWIAVKAIDAHLRARGNETRLNSEGTVRPNFEMRGVYGDRCDLFFRPANPWRLVEVKGRTFDFTCEQDFPYDTIIIDRATKQKDVEIDLYVNVSKDLCYAAFVDGKVTRPFWITRKIFDSTKGYEVINYECPKNLARFRKLLP